LELCIARLLCWFIAVGCEFGEFIKLVINVR